MGHYTFTLGKKQFEYTSPAKGSAVADSKNQDNLDFKFTNL